MSSARSAPCHVFADWFDQSCWCWLGGRTGAVVVNMARRDRKINAGMKEANGQLDAEHLRVELHPGGREHFMKLIDLFDAFQQFTPNIIKLGISIIFSHVLFAREIYEIEKFENLRSEIERNCEQSSLFLLYIGCASIRLHEHLYPRRFFPISLLASVVQYYAHNRLQPTTQPTSICCLFPSRRV